ncbi:MAG TPA: PH domain-containing protein [Streptosporangiaceae bacterium]
MSSPTPKPMTSPAAGNSTGSAGATGEREVFRLNAPLVIWWIWLAFAAFNIVDLSVQASPRFAVVVGLIVATITGLAYACGLRPRVIADGRGLTIVNPVREFAVPWAAIRAVDVRDWVRFSCTPVPGSGRTRVLESWALFATARVKRNYTQRARDYAAKTPATNRIPDEARHLISQPAVVIIARRIEQRAHAEQAAGAPEAPLTARWAWFSIATMVLPAAALVIALFL